MVLNPDRMKKAEKDKSITVHIMDLWSSYAIMGQSIRV